MSALPAETLTGLNNVQDLEASKAKLQKEFNQNEVSVQTLQVTYHDVWCSWKLLPCCLINSIIFCCLSRVSSKSNKDVSVHWRLN